MKDDVVFKGTRNGVLVVLHDQTEYDVLKQRLAERLDAAENFFYPGAGVTLDVGSRILSTTQLLELEQLLQQPHGLKLMNVIHSSPAVAAASEQRNWWADPAPMTTTVAATAEVTTGRTSAVEAQKLAAPAESADEETADEHTILVKRTLRSGQRIRYNGNVVILGEVNPGAEIVAAGDIVVMGSLRGVAHAGAQGNADAVVVATRLQPTQLRIAGFIGRPPDGEVAPTGPELARVKNGAIMIEADPHRFF